LKELYARIDIFSFVFFIVQKVKKGEKNQWQIEIVWAVNH